jgi:hypothetical protein
VKDPKVSHTRSGDPIVCPCRSLARLVDALSSLPTNTALRTFCTATATSQFTGREILEAVHQGARWDNLHLVGYDYTHIGTHSLHSRGATRLRLEGFNKDVIQLMGRWSREATVEANATDLPLPDPPPPGWGMGSLDSMGVIARPEASFTIADSRASLTRKTRCSGGLPPTPPPHICRNWPVS